MLITAARKSICVRLYFFYKGAKMTKTLTINKVPVLFLSYEIFKGQNKIIILN